MVRLAVHAGLVFLLAVVAGEGLLVAEPPEDTAISDDVQDVVFLGRSRPLLIRLHLTIDGKPAAARWEAFLRRLFDYFDRDGDGVLNKAEADRVLRPYELAPVFDGGVLQLNIPVRQAPDGLDADGDGKVTFREFLDYYRRDNAGPASVQPFNDLSQFTDAIDEALFKALDLNGDGKLSPVELTVAEQSLRTLDVNDDEMIDAQELLPGGLVGRQGVPDGAVAPALVLVQKEIGAHRARERLAAVKEILSRYDTDRDQKLDRDEVRLPRKLFARLDRNRDGKLDALELLQYVRGEPDVEVSLHLAAPGTSLKGTTIEPASGSAALERVSPYALALPIDGGRLHLHNAPLAAGVLNVMQQRSQYTNFFRQLDMENRGYLTRQQVAATGAQNFVSLFDLADRDEDGKLTLKELEALGEVFGSGMGSRTQLVLARGGRRLFGALDVDGDGRLSVRELRGAAARLAPLGRGPDGGLRLGDLPEHFFIVAAQGQPFYGVNAVLQPFFGGAPRPSLPALRGPVWFRKMDRNQDGDLSPREFLGTPAQFRKLDLDGDGLISVEEAERADQELRKKSPNPPGK
jgi:Ca2+-binding EF-hand superfamily protein